MEYYHYLCFFVTLGQLLPAPTTSYILIRPNQRSSQDRAGTGSVADLAEKIAERTAHKLKYILEEYKGVKSDDGHPSFGAHSAYVSAETAAPYEQLRDASYEVSNEEIKEEPPLISDTEQHSYDEDQMKDADPVPDLRDGDDFVEEVSDYENEKKDSESYKKDRLMVNGKYYDRSRDNVATRKKNQQKTMDKLRVVRVHSEGQLDDKQKAKVMSKLIADDVNDNK